jgi:CheY-like chemotaxis protein
MAELDGQEAWMRVVLAVDDDEAILDLMQMILEDEGYRVLLARDGAEALEMLESTRPDLILLDMRMPNVNGPQFADAYRQTPGPHAPIVLVTAARDAPDAASEVGARAHLLKPFDVADLIQVVSAFVPEGAL